MLESKCPTSLACDVVCVFVPAETSGDGDSKVLAGIDNFKCVVMETMKNFQDLPVMRGISNGTTFGGSFKFHY